MNTKHGVFGVLLILISLICLLGSVAVIVIAEDEPTVQDSAPTEISDAPADEPTTLEENHETTATNDEVSETPQDTSVIETQDAPSESAVIAPTTTETQDTSSENVAPTPTATETQDPSPESTTTAPTATETQPPSSETTTTAPTAIEPQEPLEPYSETTTTSTAIEVDVQVPPPESTTTSAALEVQEPPIENTTMPTKMPRIGAVIQVSTWAEMSAALTNNTITTIQLTADITCGANVTIANTKPSNLTIDGQGHNYDSSSYCATFTTTATFNTVTIQNLTIIGTNVSGPFYCPSSSLTPMLKYINVNYTGAQITCIPYGIAYYKDCNNITINGQECTEAASVIYDGTVTITKTSGNNYHINYLITKLNNSTVGSIEVKPNATVTITINPSVTNTGFVVPPSSNVMPMQIDSGAKFSFVGPRVTNGNTFSNIILQDGTPDARTVYKVELSTATSNDVLATGGNFTVGNYADVIVCPKNNSTAKAMNVGGILSVGNHSTITTVPALSTYMVQNNICATGDILIGDYSTVSIATNMADHNDTNKGFLYTHGNLVTGIGSTIDINVGGANTFMPLVYVDNGNITIGAGGYFRVKSTANTMAAGLVYASGTMSTGQNSDIELNASGTGSPGASLVNVAGDITIGSSTGSATSDTTQFNVLSSAPTSQYFVQTGGNLTVNDNAKLTITPQNTSTNYAIYTAATTGKCTVGNNAKVLINSPQAGTTNSNGIKITGSGGLQTGENASLIMSCSGKNSGTSFIDVPNGSLATGRGSNVQVTASGANLGYFINIYGNISTGEGSNFEAYGSGAYMNVLVGSVHGGITIGDSSTFYLTGNTSSMSYCLIQPSNSGSSGLIIGNNAKFHAITTSVMTTRNQLVYVPNAPFTVGNNAECHIIAQDASTKPVFSINGTAGKVNFNAPKDVIFYGKNKNLVDAASTFNINNVQQINYWDTAVETPNIFTSTATTAYAQPHYSWRGGNDSALVSITGTMSGSAFTTMNLAGSPVNNPDIAPLGGTDAPTTTTFDMAAANVIAFGTLSPTIDYAYLDAQGTNTITVTLPGVPAPGDTALPGVSLTPASTAVQLLNSPAQGGAYTLASTQYVPPSVASSPFTTNVSKPSLWEVLCFQNYLISQAKQNQYTVTYHYNGGTAEPYLGTILVNEGYPLTSPLEHQANPHKPSHIFGGWYATSDFTSGVWDFANTRVSKNTDLYAQWTHATTTSDTPIFVEAKTGYTQSIALDTLGYIWCWGGGENGCIGAGNTSANTTPQRLYTTSDGSALPKFIDVDAGVFASYAVDESGNLWSWGQSINGQLGMGIPASDQTRPYKITKGDADVPLPKFVKVEAGNRAMMALDKNGNVWTWGSGANNLNGSSTGETIYAPKQLSGLTNVISIASGGNVNYALTRTGKAFGWGDNTANCISLTSSTTAPSDLTPLVSADATDLPIIAQVSGGKHQTVILDTGGDLWAWGYNAWGELGRGIISSSDPNNKTMTKLTQGNDNGATVPLPKFKSVSFGTEFLVAVDVNGFLWACGYAGSYETGLGSTATTSFFTKIPLYFYPTVDTTVPNTKTTFISVDAHNQALDWSSNYAMALDSNGRIWSWGHNSTVRNQTGVLPSLNLIQRPAPAVFPAATLSFGALPASISFGTNVIMPGVSKFMPTSPVSMTVQDTRGAGRSWKVLASLSAPLTTTDSFSSMRDALLFIDGHGGEHVLGQDQTEIYNGTTAALPTTTISFPANTGFALKSNATVVKSKPYTGTITWTLVDAP